MSTFRSGLGQRRIGRKFWIPVGCLALVFAFSLFSLPSFHDKYFGVAKNEATAVGGLRKIYELENEYAAAHRDYGFACQLSQLRPKENMLDARPMNLLTGEWVGYKYEIVACAQEKNGVFARYQVTAVPLRPWSSGVRAFCTDQSGDIFYDHTGSASECLATRHLLPRRVLVRRYRTSEISPKTSCPVSQQIRHVLSRLLQSGRIGHDYVSISRAVNHSLAHSGQSSMYSSFYDRSRAILQTCPSPKFRAHVKSITYKDIGNMLHG
jgi:hypothetical protein